MREFYILSLKWTKKSDRILTFWGPNNSGYVYRLERAGKYTAEQVNEQRSYYDGGEHTRAVPCDVVDALAVTVADVESRQLDHDVSPTDHVVRYAHIRTLRKPRA